MHDNASVVKRIVVAIVRRGPEILLVRRRRREGNLHWQFPGGEVEANETAEQAAVREVAEETGVTCSVVDSLGQREHPGTGVHITYILCTYLGGDATVIDEDELDRVAWLEPRDVLKLITSNIFPPVREYIDGLSRAGDK